MMWAVNGFVLISIRFPTIILIGKFSSAHNYVISNPLNYVLENFSGQQKVGRVSLLTLSLFICVCFNAYQPATSVITPSVVTFKSGS